MVFVKRVQTYIKFLSGQKILFSKYIYVYVVPRMAINSRSVT
jgi:hypothetical protein